MPVNSVRMGKSGDTLKQAGQGTITIVWKRVGSVEADNRLQVVRGQVTPVPQMRTAWSIARSQDS